MKTLIVKVIIGIVILFLITSLFPQEPIPPAILNEIAMGQMSNSEIAPIILSAYNNNYTELAIWVVGIIIIIIYVLKEVTK